MACSPKEKQVSAIFHTDEDDSQTGYPDLPELQQNGEIIAITLSGPDTYFEFRGQSFGMQYELAADFARSQGLRIRMEIAHDTLEMLEKLRQGEADVITLPMTAQPDLQLSAIQDSASGGWITRNSSPQLAQALDNWYRPAIKQQIIDKQKKINTRQSTFTTRHTPRAKVKNAHQGIISDYDHLFRRHARTCGWDWRLLAAQCYQESAFDPQAVSWAGAQGLMQLMPKTAAQYGVASQVFNPEANIQASTQMLRDLNTAFSDIPNTDERISFVLASYNGGTGHIRDAMALTEKYGGDAHRWSEVSKYVLLLSDAQHYRDPIVKYGYLRGTETTNYVSSIRSHWAYYRGIAEPSNR